MGNLSLGNQGLTPKGKICNKFKPSSMKYLRKREAQTKKYNVTAILCTDIHCISVCLLPKLFNYTRQCNFFAASVMFRIVVWQIAARGEVD